MPATLEEVIQLIQRGDPRTWESRPCNELDLTFEQAVQVFNEKQISFGESTWLGYGLLNREHELTNLALLLSDQNPYRVVVNTFVFLERLKVPKELTVPSYGNGIKCGNAFQK